jgi:hypothetical protein
MSANSVDIIVVEKNATLKTLVWKDNKVEDLYKKCGFKNPDGFKKQTEWKSKMNGKQYFVSVYAKEEGRANTENKYDFPPPIDTRLFFGSCAIVLEETENGSKKYTSLNVELWEKIYEKLFVGFEDLKMTIAEDDDEEDELANVPASKKTKQGYLKDGFVVDSDAEDDEDECYSSDEDDDDNDDNDNNEDEEEEDEKELLENIGSELSEEDYEESSDDETIQ